MFFPRSLPSGVPFSARGALRVVAVADVAVAGVVAVSTLGGVARVPRVVLYITRG